MTTADESPFGSDTSSSDTSSSSGTPSRADLDAQIAELTAQRDAQPAPVDTTPAAAAVAEAPAASGLAVGDPVHYATHDRLNGSSLSGLAIVARVVESYENPDGSMSEPQYVVAPLVELGILLGADELTAV